MDSNKFDSLMVKLQAATWTLHNAISNTKFFTSTINEQKIKLINVENAPVYINSQRLNLTDLQIQTMLEFVDQLITTFAPEIEATNNEKRQSMITALDRILE